MQTECLLMRSNGCIFNGFLTVCGLFFYESHTVVELTSQAPCQPVAEQSRLRAPGSAPGALDVISTSQLQTETFSLLFPHFLHCLLQLS